MCFASILFQIFFFLVSFLLLNFVLIICFYISSLHLVSLNCSSKSCYIVQLFINISVLSLIMIQRFSLSPSISPLLSLFFIYFTRFHYFPSPAISCYPPSAFTLCSLPETFTVATTLETSTVIEAKEGWREGRIPRTTFPRRARG